jgi:hypothetical protein
VTDWSISKSWAIEPPTGTGYDAAYIVRLNREPGLSHDLIVEFAAPSVLASIGYAEEIARRFLHESELPSHVIVDVQRAVRVVEKYPGGSNGVANRE